MTTGTERSRTVKLAPLAAACAFALALAGCPSSRLLEGGPQDQLPHGSPDAGAVADAGGADAGVVADAGGASKAFIFAPAAGDPGLNDVWIVSGVVSGETLTVRLSTGGLPDVYGLYFRLTYDPAVLAFQALTPSAKFPAGVLSRAAERKGTLIAGITNKGTLPSIRFDKGEEIAAIRFRIIGKDQADIAFIPELSGVLDKYLQPVAKSWVGGKLEYR